MAPDRRNLGIKILITHLFYREVEDACLGNEIHGSDGPL